MARLFNLALAMIAPCALSGCYIIQAAQGQAALLSKRRPISTVIANPATPATVKISLEHVLEIREFAVGELGLPDNGSYRSYVDLGRPYVVWNVFAAPEFSVSPERWCFPITGCVAYRGYFSERRAQKFAAKLARRGKDVFVGGVPAYSTLGHFDDPILNSMLGWNDVQLAAILFHELTHQLLYVPSDTPFNEALATVIEEEGVKRWLIHHGREHELTRYNAQRARYTQAARLFIAGRERLRALYASGAPLTELRARKELLLEELKTQYRAFRRPGDAFVFNDWVATGLNNAHLTSVASYEECVPGLRRLLRGHRGDLGAFYVTARQLAALDRSLRHARVCGPS